MRHHEPASASRPTFLVVAALGTVALWAGGTLVAAAQGRPAVPQVPEAAGIFEGLATTAAPDEPVRLLSNPAGPAFVEGRRWGVVGTVAQGTSGITANPVYVHAIGISEGGNDQGWALWAKNGGRDAWSPAEPGAPAFELALGYTYAMGVSSSTALGINGHYRRVRVPVAGQDGWPVRDDHYLGLDLGLLSAVGDRVVVGASIENLLELRQVGPAGPAEHAGETEGRAVVVNPGLSAGIAYQPNTYLILEADVVDLLNVQGRRALRSEVRVYPAPPLAVRLGVEMSEGGGSGWLAGLGVELPGGRWAASYTFMGGQSYGGVHQLGLMTAIP